MSDGGRTDDTIGLRTLPAGGRGTHTGRVNGKESLSIKGDLVSDEVIPGLVDKEKRIFDQNEAHEGSDLHLSVFRP